MYIRFWDRALGGSMGHLPLQNTMPVHPIEDLPSSFGDPGQNLSDSELRETAYEILVGAWRSSGPKPLTFISQSERGDRNPAQSPSLSLHTSLTSTAASKVKKALGLKTLSSNRKGSGGDSVSQGRSKRTVTTGEFDEDADEGFGADRNKNQTSPSESSCRPGVSFVWWKLEILLQFISLMMLIVGHHCTFIIPVWLVRNLKELPK